MSEVRIIKKYPNRRLYDTATSEYITLADVKRLILEKVPLKIIDAKTEKDLTHNSLLQIFFEEEGGDSPILTPEILENMIRAYGNSMQTLMSRFFEQSLHHLLTQQSEFQEQWEKLMGSPTSGWAELAQRNMSAWTEWQQQFFKGLSKPPSKKEDS